VNRIFELLAKLSAYPRRRIKHFIQIAVECRKRCNNRIGAGHARAEQVHVVDQNGHLMDGKLAYGLNTYCDVEQLSCDQFAMLRTLNRNKKNKSLEVLNETEL
jgi:hypothetical protein